MDEISRLKSLIKAGKLDTTKLVKKQVIDKRGHRTTKWVKVGEEKGEGILAGILRFFGLKSDKAAQEKGREEYIKHKDQLDGVSLEAFVNHLNEYLSNKEKWDKRITAERKGGAGGGSKGGEKKTSGSGGEKQKSSFSLAIMRKIAGIYGSTGNDNNSKDAEFTVPDLKFLDKTTINTMRNKLNNYEIPLDRLKKLYESQIKPFLEEHKGLRSELRTDTNINSIYQEFVRAEKILREVSPDNLETMPEGKGGETAAQIAKKYGWGVWLDQSIDEINKEIEIVLNRLGTKEMDRQDHEFIEYLEKIKAERGADKREKPEGEGKDNLESFEAYAKGVEGRLRKQMGDEKFEKLYMSDGKWKKNYEERLREEYSKKTKDRSGKGSGSDSSDGSDTDIDKKWSEDFAALPDKDMQYSEEIRRIATRNNWHIWLDQSNKDIYDHIQKLESKPNAKEDYSAFISFGKSVVAERLAAKREANPDNSDKREVPEVKGDPVSELLSKQKKDVNEKISSSILNAIQKDDKSGDYYYQAKNGEIYRLRNDKYNKYVLFRNDKELGRYILPNLSSRTAAVVAGKIKSDISSHKSRMKEEKLNKEKEDRFNSLRVSDPSKVQPGQEYTSDGIEGELMRGDEKTILEKTSNHKNAVRPSHGTLSLKKKYLCDEKLLKQGVMTDGSFLIMDDPEKLSKYFDDNMKTLVNHETDRIMRAKMNNVDSKQDREKARALAIKNVERDVKNTTGGSNASETWKNIIPKEIPDKAAKIVGAHKSENTGSWSSVLTDGDKMIRVNSDYLSTFKEHYPDAVFLITGGTSPVIVQSKGKTVGVVMPLQSNKRSPIIDHFSGLEKAGTGQGDLLKAKARYDKPIDFQGILI